MSRRPKKGSAIILPRNIAHATWNESGEPATALTIVSQHSKFEGFFDDVVERIRSRGIIEPQHMAAVVAESGPDYGVTIDMSPASRAGLPHFRHSGCRRLTGFLPRALVAESMDEQTSRRLIARPNRAGFAIVNAQCKVTASCDGLSKTWGACLGEALWSGICS